MPPEDLHAAASVLGDVPKRVDRGVGATGADLQQQVTTGQRGLEVVVGERHHRRQVGRLALGDPEAVVEQRGAESDSDRQPVGRRSQDRACRCPTVAIRARGRPARRRRSGTGLARSAFSALDQLRARGRGDVERGEARCRWRRGGDSGLPHAVERHRRQPGRGVAGRRRTAAGRPPAVGRAPAAAWASAAVPSTRPPLRPRRTG